MTKRIAMALCAGLLGLAGCAGPVISKDIREVSWPVSGFAEVRENPDKFKDKTIIVGGTIMNTINNEDGSSSLIVLSLPLGDEERPEKWGKSQGQFMVNTVRFLEPQVYAKGREVTVAGVVIGTKTAPVGETQYRYVVLNARQLYLWPPPSRRFNMPIHPELHPDRSTEADYSF